MTWTSAARRARASGGPRGEQRGGSRLVADDSRSRRGRVRNTAGPGGGSGCFGCSSRSDQDAEWDADNRSANPGRIRQGIGGGLRPLDHDARTCMPFSLRRLRCYRTT